MMMPVFRIIAMALIISLVPGEAKAVFCPNSIPPMTSQLNSDISQRAEEVREYITDEMIRYRKWLTDDFFLKNMAPAMRLASEQMSVFAMYQMLILGALLDAKNQLETQRLFQDLATRAHKDYQPSNDMCAIGSNTRSLANSERNAELATKMISRRSFDRQLLTKSAGSAEGPKEDREGRILQFRARYCDKNDNNRGLKNACALADTTNDPVRVNKDVDYARTLGVPITLGTDFSNLTSATGMPPPPVESNEEDLFALMSNMYAHDGFEQIASSKLRGKSENKNMLLDLRSIIAKRSVAEQSFHAIAGMKARSSTNTASASLSGLLQEMGLSAGEANAIITDKPGYYAQMEVLTKSIFRRPEFFADLIDTPANLKRKRTALKAISLLQKRDMFESSLRTEAMISVLLELEVMSAQRRVQAETDRLSDSRP